MLEVSEEYVRHVIGNPIILTIFVLSTVIPWYTGAWKLTLTLPTFMYFGIRFLIQKHVHLYIEHRDDMKDILKAFGDQFFVAEMAEKVVGTVGFLSLPDEYQNTEFNGEILSPKCKMVLSVSVDISYRRLGIAKLLMEHIHEINDKSKTDLFLITSMAQVGAAALYRRLGYDEVRQLVTENPTAAGQFTDAEKYIYGDILGFFEYEFFRKTKEKTT